MGAGDSQYSVAASGKIIDSQDVYTFRDVRVNILRAFRPDDDGGVQSYSVSAPFFSLSPISQTKRWNSCR